MPRSRQQRVVVIADAGIHILATRGRHALTHRAVDAQANLPPGSTSYYARTRDALLTVILERIAALDVEGTEADTTAGAGSGGPEGAPAPPGAVPAAVLADPDALADLMSAMLYERHIQQRDRTLARYELSLEAVHNAALRAALELTGQRFRTEAEALLAAAGSPSPARHGRLLVAICDGIVFDSLVGAGSAWPPSPSDVASGLREVLRGMLAGGDAPSPP